jgi:predicted homoserine dehydrogenase-like protein
VNLYSKLAARAANNNPVTVGIIGGGKFGSMFLAQARLTIGLQVAAVIDLAPERARANLAATGWSPEQYAASSIPDALKSGSTWVGDNAEAMIAADGIDVVVDATGDPAAGIRHALLCCEHGKNVVMVNVEADALAGPLLARRAEEAGVIYSLAYGDQPALICEQVDWARAIGFRVVSAGKGTRYLPKFHQSTPDNVFENYFVDADVAKRGNMNPKMSTSFIDGTKSAIEMTAVCNATGLTPQANGLSFPPVSCYELADVLKPSSAGGSLDHAGTTEVISCLHRDGTDVEHHLQMGVYVVVEADNDYVSHCFEEYNLLHDKSARYSAMYKPTHLIGLELGISVASIALRGEATGTPNGFRSDVVATAKRDLKPGEILDGEGGYCVWGKQMPAQTSVSMGALPLGLANNVKLKNDVKQGQQVCWTDVEIDETDLAVRFRRQMEQAFSADEGSQ